MKTLELTLSSDPVFKKYGYFLIGAIAMICIAKHISLKVLFATRKIKGSGCHIGLRSTKVTRRSTAVPL